MKDEGVVAKRRLEEVVRWLELLVPACRFMKVIKTALLHCSINVESQAIAICR